MFLDNLPPSSVFNPHSFHWLCGNNLKWKILINYGLIASWLVSRNWHHIWKETEKFQCGLISLIQFADSRGQTLLGTFPSAREKLHSYNG